jgi:GxxExxY protein
LDFLVENKIVVEIKRGTYFNPADFDQVERYLVQTDLKLGILIRFASDKVLSKRVINLNVQNNAA